MGECWEPRATSIFGIPIFGVSLALDIRLGLDLYLALVLRRLTWDDVLRSETV